MRQRLVLLCLLLVCAALCQAANPAPALAGRWEGDVQIPGSGLHVVIDLDQKGAAWVGSAIVPGYGVKGAPLSPLTVKDRDIEFKLKHAIGDPTFKAQLEADGTLKGKFTLGENSAPFVLTRTGAAQVELPKTSTPVSNGLKGNWRGDLQFLTQKLNVVLKLNGSDPAKPGEFVVTEWGPKSFPIELWTEEGNNVAFVAAEGFTFEGELSKDEIAGTFRVSIIEQPLTLRRAAAN